MEAYRKVSKDAGKEAAARTGRMKQRTPRVDWRTVNTQGTLSLVIPPIRGALLAPMLRVRAEFMDTGEWLVIAPDRHLHWKLSRLTPEALQQGRTVPEDVASAFAPAIAALASGCYEHRRLGGLVGAAEVDQLAARSPGSWMRSSKRSTRASPACWPTWGC